MRTQKKRSSGEAIEQAIAREDWLRARRLIRAVLSREPDSHWLLSRLALTYYEQRQYRRALNYEIKALQIEPYCPMAIWGYAGTLDMLERRKEALEIYRWLISCGEDELAYGQCGEGIQRARSLIADCFYRIARIHERIGLHKRALRFYNEHLSRRNRGTRSIYPLKVVKANMKALQERAKASNSSIHK
jgi:tetratricopeptide (TPR) repeat protein